MYRAVWKGMKQCLWLSPMVLALNETVGGVSAVEGRSMQPTLNPGGQFFTDKVFMEKRSVRNHEYHRGDVVVLRSPEEPNMLLIKRLIAIQGDLLTVPQSRDIVRVPKGHCWVEGDNQAVSLDSKVFGPVPLALLQGRVTHIIWPISRIGRVDNRHKPDRVIVSMNKLRRKDKKDF